MCHKAPYLTRREASAAARRFKRHSNQQRPYLCPTCQMWHLWHLWTQHARGKRAQYRQDKRKELT